jgi:hypothetical protein
MTGSLGARDGPQATYSNKLHDRAPRFYVGAIMTDDEFPLLYQENPRFASPKITRFGRVHVPKSYTQSIESFTTAGEAIVQSIAINRELRGQPYTWEAEINFERVLRAEEVAPFWNKVCRKLRKQGVVALWVVEVRPKNLIHYHLLVASEHSEQALRRIFTEALPEDVPHRVHVNPLDDYLNFARYIFKVKVPGLKKGELCADINATNRLLFKPKLPFHKHGTIGPFWAAPKKAIEEERRSRGKKFNEEMEARLTDEIRQKARYVYEAMGRTVALQDIERSFALNNEAMSGIWVEAIEDGWRERFEEMKRVNDRKEAELRERNEEISKDTELLQQVEFNSWDRLLRGESDGADHEEKGGKQHER